MKIIKEPTSYHEYAFEYDYSKRVLAFCRALKDRHGFKKITFYEGKWRFNGADIAMEISMNFPETEIETGLKSQIDLHKMALEEELAMSMRADQIRISEASSISTIKGLKGQMREYQKIGVEFFVNNKGRGILSDEMGSGKTYQALGYLVYSKKELSLVVPPASMKYVWETEVKKWTHLRPLVVDKKIKPEDLIYKIDEERANVVIINYDILKKYGAALKLIRFDACVLDESHYIKSPKAIRTKQVRAITKNIPSVILLSGTPLLSRPVELFSLLNLVDPKLWDNFYEFSRRYCDGHMGPFGWNAKGASNIEELYQRIKGYFLRRRKEDILKELPPRQIIHCPVELASSEYKKYYTALTDFGKYLKEVKKKKNAEVSRLMSSESLTKLGELRMITSMGKINAAADLIDSIIESGEKVVVFSVYNAPLDILAERYKDEAVMITGRTPNEDRRDIVDKFQKDKKVKVFLGGIKSAGAGITLTAASKVVFIDFSWVPADHLQAQDRTHRLGQTASTVQIYQLYSRNTIDEDMINLLAEKQKIFDMLVDGKEMTPETSVVKDLLSIIEKKSKEKFK